MDSWIRILSITLLVTGLFIVRGHAGWEWSILNQQAFDSQPLDMTISQSDQRLFVLLEGGEIQVFSMDGQRLDRFKVGAEAKQLSVSADGQRLFLSNPRDKQLQVVEIAYVFDLPIGTSPVKGPAKAPVTLTVFDDFQCPYCARLAPLLDQVLETYPNQVRLVFKHFPLRMHKFAQAAAVASMAAQEQGKFWEMHDQLFAHFNELDEDKIQSLAETVGLDMSRFDQAMKNPDYLKALSTDLRLGQQVGVRGTPTVFINGKLVRERSPTGLRLLIDQELAKHKRE